MLKHEAAQRCGHLRVTPMSLFHRRASAAHLELVARHPRGQVGCCHQARHLSLICSGATKHVCVLDSYRSDPGGARPIWEMVPNLRLPRALHVRRHLRLWGILHGHLGRRTLRSHCDDHFAGLFLPEDLAAAGGGPHPHDFGSRIAGRLALHDANRTVPRRELVFVMLARVLAGFPAGLRCLRGRLHPHGRRSTHRGHRPMHVPGFGAESGLASIRPRCSYSVHRQRRRHRERSSARGVWGRPHPLDDGLRCLQYPDVVLLPGRPELSDPRNAGPLWRRLPLAAGFHRPRPGEGAPSHDGQHHHRLPGWVSGGSL
mmetsp:Transcript_73011/g.159653  ORF Transcript_73011/g.159653 Transcript_73011/m.159653 type:complete len:315 (+) Transcript_73011:510-1454(+)